VWQLAAVPDRCGWRGGMATCDTANHERPREEWAWIQLRERMPSPRQREQTPRTHGRLGDLSASTWLRGLDVGADWRVLGGATRAGSERA
jgi:hypothetical protein